MWGSGNTGTKLVGRHLSRRTKCLGIICPWGPNFMGILCQGRQEVGDRKSGHQMGSGTKCVVAVLNGIVIACLGLLTLIRIIKPVIKYDMTARGKATTYSKRNEILSENTFLT